jgi:cell division protein FtsW
LKIWRFENLKIYSGMDKTTNFPRSLKPGGDVVLWIIAVILAAVSVLVVYSSKGVEVLGEGGNHISVLVRQLGYVTMGLGVIYLVHRVKYQYYRRAAWLIYGIALAFALLVYFIGEGNPAAPNAPRWILIPIINMTFQPSDLLKVATLMVLASELASRQRIIASQPILPPFSARGWREDDGGKIVRERTIPLLLPVAVSCGVILSSNLSTALILFATCFVMLFIGRVQLRDLGKLLFVVIVAGGVLAGANYAVSSLSSPQKAESAQQSQSGGKQVFERSGTWSARLERFFGGEKGHQVEQAEMAIASGGLTGSGPGDSTQRGLLPEADSDYVFAFMIEEYGSLGGGLFILLLYLWVFFRGIVIFNKCGTAFPSLLVLGLALLITLQAMINMMVATNLLPSTGIALPLISRGGSSELFLSFALGMMLGVSRQTQQHTLDKPRGETLLEINPKV